MKAATKTTLGLTLALGALLGVGQQAHADNALEQVFSARSLGMGASLRGAATGSAGPLNPAGVALVKAYALEGSYGYRPDDGETQVNASVADSTARVAMALYYSYMTATRDYILGDGATIRTGEIDRVRHEVGAATSFPLSDRFALGTTLKYTSFEANLTDPADGSRSNVSSQGRVNLDIGGVVALAPRLTLGLVGYNLLAHDGEYPRAFGGGLALGLGDTAMMTLDGVVDLTSTSDLSAPGDDRRVKVSGGAEVVLANMYPVRAGVIWGSYADDVYVTGGLGYQSPRVGLDVAIRQKVEGGSETVGLVALKFYLPTDQTTVPSEM